MHELFFNPNLTTKQLIECLELQEKHHRELGDKALEIASKLGSIPRTG